jgi:F0F1-type ATP synthase membrane subunit b/b'
MERAPSSVRPSHELRFPLRRRGYDPFAVDELVDRLTGELDELRARLSPMTLPAPVVPDAAAGRVLALAQHTADAAIADAQHQADVIVATANAHAGMLAADAERRSNKTIDEAEAWAAQLLTQAEETTRRLTSDAERLLDEARRSAQHAEARAQARAAQLVADAESEARRHFESRRERLLAELAEMQVTRQRLLDDIAALDSHVRAQRDRVARDAHRLLALVTGDDTFLAEPMPEISGATADAGGAGPVDEDVLDLRDLARDPELPA